MTTATQIGVLAAARFRDTANTVVSASLWLAYLNEAYNDVNTHTPLWPWLETAEQTISLVAGTRSAALPTGVWTVNWVYDVTDDYRLIPQEGRGDQWHQDRLRSETGQPVTYRLRNSNIEVFPNPTANTSLVAECVSWPAVLAGGDSPVFGQQWDTVLLDGMLSRAYDDDGNDKWADRHEARFLAGKNKMLTAILYARTETNAPIRDVFWS